MARHVKGVWFADYVRMIRAHKHVDWSRHLGADELASLGERVRADGWYPMERFERLGLAILSEVAHGDVALVRHFGRASIDAVAARGHLAMLVVGDPQATLMRFNVYRRELFDFVAVEVEKLLADRARLRVAYGMGAPAEEAACYQTMGFFERLAELAGAAACEASFASKGWAGDPTTLIELRWQPPSAAGSRRGAGA